MNSEKEEAFTLDFEEDTTHLHIAVKAEAILGIFALCEAGQVQLMASDALVFETTQNPHPVRKRHASEVLAKASMFVPTDRRVEERARAFLTLGLKPLDALHLAAAVEAQADYFCTCDDRLLRRAKTVDTLRTKVVSPLELSTQVTR